MENKQTGLTINVNITDTDTFKEFFSLSLWMFRRLDKINQDYAHKQFEQILGREFDLTALEELRKQEGVNAQQSKELLNQPLYTIFEKEFGRPLSQFEIGMLTDWEERNGYSQQIIKLALKEAIISRKLNFKYIDRILFNWEKEGIKTVEEANEYSRRFRFKSGRGATIISTQNNYQRKQMDPAQEQAREPVPFYNWLESD